MRRAVVVNLSTMRRGGGVTHVSGFLPELVSRRPDLTFRAVVARSASELVASWGVDVVTHDVPVGSMRLRLTLDQWKLRRLAAEADILLSPMNHGTLNVSIPQIVWACNALYFEAPTSLTGRANAWLARSAMRSADLVVYPSMSTRAAAEAWRIQTPGLVLRHPIGQDLAFAPPAPRDESTPLRIFVPSSNQRHKNLMLLPRVSSELTRRGVAHRIAVTCEEDASIAGEHITAIGRYDLRNIEPLRAQHDMVFIPSAAESYSYPLAEFEWIGFPVAASDIPAHREIAQRAHLFHPASAEGAAQAIIDAANAGPALSPNEDRSAVSSTPAAYAEAISTEIDRLIGSA